MIPCAYCDKPCQPTREHIIPRWYSLTPGEAETFNARRPITHLKGDIIIKDVCSNCNGGILSQLDAFGKNLYDDYLSVPAGSGDVVEVAFDVDLLSRWFLKLSFNSGRANGTDLPVLSQYRDGILGSRPIGPNFVLFCHLIGPSIIDNQQNLVRPATLVDREEEKIPPDWFRICQMRLPISPMTQLVQRQILINSYAFSMIVAQATAEVSTELQDAVAVFRKTYPSAVELLPDARSTKLFCISDHAAQSIDQLYSAFPNRFGYESNDYTKRLLNEQTRGTILALTRDMVEDGDVQTASEALKALVRNREMALAHRMRVGLMVEGYDDDQRELWEVPEVREYIRKLFLECPFVILLAHPELSLLKLLFACWIFEPNEKSDDAMKARELDFLHRCFAGDNEVAYRLCMAPETQKEAEKSALQTLYPDLSEQEFEKIPMRSANSND